jgi:aryl-phospho-beta-D-glucosidase BglC (GH1 family)
MEWAKPGLRYGQSTKPNLNFSVPRAADVGYLAAQGFSKNRLPIQWELLQPVLHDTNANATVRAIVGEPGAFHAGYEAYITQVLDAHAAAGIRCIIDLHNYGRYQDFIYNADGSVTGLSTSRDPLIRPFTTDGSKVQERIFATAAGSTLKVANFADFWSRAATRWKGHPGLGGFCLMNEPHDLPNVGRTTVTYDGEDLNILAAFHQAAIDAIRAVDPDTPIYVSGNGWQAAMTLGTQNPAWPLRGTNLIYDVHMYLDASCSGYAFDYDTEAAKGYSAGIGGVPIDQDTGVKRLKFAVDWAASKGVKLALTEVGMPIDDIRWQTMFQRAVDFARANNVEVYSWMGGNHWPSRNYALNHVPGWHQNQTLEPAVSGPMKMSAGIVGATLYDDGPGWAPAGTPVTITVYARGSLAAPVSVTVSSSNGGTLSKTTLTIPAGANGSDTYTFTPASNSVVTLSYASSRQVPPPRKVYSLADPVAYASTNLRDAAMAILARYSASKWEMADGYTDFVLGAPAADGQNVRAVCDSGFGSSAGNAMEMLNWINTQTSMGTMSAPVMRSANGKKCADMSVYDTFGFWCKKSEPTPGVQANPKARVPYNIDESHFAIACISVPSIGNSGVVFQAGKTEDYQVSELALSSGQPQANFRDVNGQAVTLTSSVSLAANTPAVIALTSVPGAQRLRVNSTVAGNSNATFAPSSFTQMLIGWGYVGYYPRGGFMGSVFSVIAGKGAPTTSELAVLERYLASTAGLAL